MGKKKKQTLNAASEGSLDSFHQSDVFKQTAAAPLCSLSSCDVFLHLSLTCHRPLSMCTDVRGAQMYEVHSSSTTSIFVFLLPPPPFASSRVHLSDSEKVFSSPRATWGRGPGPLSQFKNKDSHLQRCPPR